MKRQAEEQGATFISAIPRDPQGFYQRMLIAGLRLSLSPVQIGLLRHPDGPALAAIGPDCRGYLFATDGIEASESDLYRFLHAELGEGEGVNIFGKYEPDPGSVVHSRAHFRHVDGRIMCSERRTLMRADGTSELLRLRSDIEHDNIRSLPISFRDPEPF